MGGCGLTSAAFCDTFDQGPATNRGRAGDLDASKWTVGRLIPSMSEPGAANPVREAAIPPCKAGAPAVVFPPFDTLICDPDARGNRRLMTAVAMQNYGSNSYMIQQPFDFTGRTGKIVFDVDAATPGGLGAFVAVEITEDPHQAPTYQEFQNNETGPIPRNGIMLKWADNCGLGRNAAKLAYVLTYNNYAMTLIDKPAFDIGRDVCPKTKESSLNHIEIQLSQNKIDVYMSDFSNDGVTFPNLKLIYTANISLPFSRGFVHMVARNHAGDKYQKDFQTDPIGIFFWDNIGFDGPVVTGHRFYGVPDNNTRTTFNGLPSMNLGYILRDGLNGGPPAGIYNPNNLISAPLQIAGVNTSGATKARITMNLYFNTITHVADATWGIRYRLNGKTWLTRNLNATELTVINNTNPNSTKGSGGNIAILMDVPIADVQNGTNTIEFLPVNAPMDYAPAIANIDLVLSP